MLDPRGVLPFKVMTLNSPPNSIQPLNSHSCMVCMNIPVTTLTTCKTRLFYVKKKKKIKNKYTHCMLCSFLLSSKVQSSLVVLTKDMSQLLSQHYYLNASPIHRRRWPFFPPPLVSCPLLSCLPPPLSIIYIRIILLYIDQV